MPRTLPLALLPLALSGCVVKAAAHIATAPVRATSWTADRLTTSRSEADEKLGRKIRKQRERDAREVRKARRQQD